MKINRENLLKQMELILPGLSTREIIEQSSCFVFKDNKIMTYNDEVACFVKTKLAIEGAVPAMPLISLLRKLQEDEIEITTTKKELRIRGKKRKAGITMEKDIQLPIKEVILPKKWKKLPSDFADAIHLISQCVGKNETHFSMVCIHLHPKYIEACDNTQAARYKTKMDIEEDVLVRGDSLKHIVSLDMTKFGETVSWIHFKNSSGLILSCRRYVGEEFPDVKEVLKNTGGKETKLPKGLNEASEKASIFSSENAEDNEVLIEMQKGKLKITGEGASGFYREIKKVKYDGKDISFTISPVLLSELVQKYDTCQISSSLLKVRSGKLTYVTALGKK